MVSNELKEMIWQLVAVIPRGKVATYGQIAKLCGYPGYARYVGHTLKQLPKGTLLPWHRVINAKGELAFPSATEAYQTQQARLLKEGVQFNNDKISLKQFGWDGAISEPDKET